jgi:hypothetical protein
MDLSLRTACTRGTAGRNSVENGTERLLLAEPCATGVLVCEAFVASESVLTRCVTNIKKAKMMYCITYFLLTKIFTSHYEIYLQLLASTPLVMTFRCATASRNTLQTKKSYKLNSMALVRERTIPTEHPPLVGEVSANLCG